MQVLLTNTYLEMVSDLMAHARSSILLSSYSLSPPSTVTGTPLAALYDTLSTRSREGLDVRMIGDASGAGDGLRSMNYRAKLELIAAGIPTRLSKMGGRHHAKFIIIDGSFVTIGSHNLSNTAFLHSFEASMLSDDADIAAELSQSFNIRWISTCL